jgi:hypothetical protein
MNNHLMHNIVFLLAGTLVGSQAHLYRRESSPVAAQTLTPPARRKARRLTDGR